ncbi:MAG: hypothetical protein JO257_27125 [Deltaproteobacteria bacterium]|nr:hypothetical protein [Deltaproteobacteria bacterium]
MRHVLLALLVAAACGGGSHKSTTPPPPLPETKAEGSAATPAKPDADKPPETAKAPEPPPGPVEIPLKAQQPTVKLVNAGKGKKAQLKLTPKAGDKVPVEIALDFTGKTGMPPELGGPQEQIAPQVIASGTLENQDVGADGTTKFQVAIAKVDAKDITGSKPSATEFKSALGSLAGATIAGSVNPNGSTTDLTIHIDKPDAHTKDALEVVHLALLPMWPVLPTEPIGAGAKWTATSNYKFADQLDVTQTTDYELVSHKGNEWVIKGTTKLSGKDQDMGAPGGQSAKVSGIAGSGSIDATISDGKLAPANKSTLNTSFTATAHVPAGDGQAAKDVAIKFELTQGTNVTSPASAPAPGPSAQK